MSKAWKYIEWGSGSSGYERGSFVIQCMGNGDWCTFKRDDAGYLHDIGIDGSTLREAKAKANAELAGQL